MPASLQVWVHKGFLTAYQSVAPRLLAIAEEVMQGAHGQTSGCIASELLCISKCPPVLHLPARCVSAPVAVLQSTVKPVDANTSTMVIWRNAGEEQWNVYATGHSTHHFLGPHFWEPACKNPLSYFITCVFSFPPSLGISSTLVLISSNDNSCTNLACRHGWRAGHTLLLRACAAQVREGDLYQPEAQLLSHRRASAKPAVWRVLRTGCLTQLPGLVTTLHGQRLVRGSTLNPLP